jgi:hypothetical protein
MNTETLPIHANFDEFGELKSIVIYNDKTRAMDFYFTRKMTFDDIGNMLKKSCKKEIEPNEK